MTYVVLLAKVPLTRSCVFAAIGFNRLLVGRYWLAMAAAEVGTHEMRKFDAPIDDAIVDYAACETNGTERAAEDQRKAGAGSRVRRFPLGSLGKERRRASRPRSASKRHFNHPSSIPQTRPTRGAAPNAIDRRKDLTSSFTVKCCLIPARWPRC